MKRKLRKRLAALAVSAFFLLAGCASDMSAASHAKPGADFSDSGNASDTWVIYWYLCGTDLESELGAASEDLAELQKVKLPPNVKVVIQTGGANQWQTGGVPANGTGRFVYDSDGLQSLGETADADMGTGAGLSDFLRFGKENFSADHRVFVFWDHGGGSVGGLCLDERTRNMISLDDVRGAFDSVYGANPDTPPFEIIGFDACLMATVETAQMASKYADYLLASEESEPGIGWYYTDWVTLLSRNTSTPTVTLGKRIVDDFVTMCARQCPGQDTTLSLT
ncbi:MAG: clostripain, partial [Schwartzia sp.]|nr:clostripain [Schwartzia sp. (in: firmicutes)]